MDDRTPVPKIEQVQREPPPVVPPDVSPAMWRLGVALYHIAVGSLERERQEQSCGRRDEHTSGPPVDTR